MKEALKYSQDQGCFFTGQIRLPYFLHGTILREKKSGFKNTPGQDNPKKTKAAVCRKLGLVEDLLVKD